jgi:valyl-tRNA synthetase
LDAAERFFWTFCDDYIELVKARGYGDGPAAESAQAALRMALQVQLRLFAPFLPYVTEEVWSWWQPTSIHRASWPSPAEVDRCGAAAGDPGVLRVASVALGHARRAKSSRQLSMKASVLAAVARGPEPDLARLALAAADFAAAAQIQSLQTDPGSHEELELTFTFAG